MSYSVLRKPVAKSGLQRRSRCPVGRATTSGTGRAVVTPLIVIAFLINGSHPQEPEFWQMKREWKGGDREKGPERACFLIKFLLTKDAFFEKSEGRGGRPRAKLVMCWRYLRKSFLSFYTNYNTAIHILIWFK